MKYPITQVIAERRIRWRLPDGTQASIVARFGMPSAFASDCYCPYEIVRFPGDVSDAELAETGERLVQHAAFGSDSVQAIYLAFVGVGAELSNIDGSPEAPVDAEANFGFPTLGVTPATDI